MAIVQASEKGKTKLHLTPDFKVQAVGTVNSIDNSVAYTFKKSQAELIGLSDFLIDYQLRNFGICMVHESYLVVS